MIDIHSHILAEVDDGPKSWEVSVEMCSMAAADGIEHIVATPHANHRYPYDREHLIQLVDYLRQRVDGKLRLSLGCDFHLSYENLEAAMASPERFVIQGGRYLLAEPSNYSIPPQIEDSLRKLIEIGVTPVITHPERNPILQKTLERVLRWVEMGCAVQVTASALTGHWGETAWRAAVWLLKRDAVHILATDAHDTKRRVPILSAGRDAAAEHCGKEVAHALVEDNPRAVIIGKAMPYFPSPIRKD